MNLIAQYLHMISEKTTVEELGKLEFGIYRAYEGKVPEELIKAIENKRKELAKHERIN
jgi:hypothetical protein